MKELYGLIRATSCCGLLEFHNLAPNYSTNSLSYATNTFASMQKEYKGRAFFATTVRSQRKEIARLKCAGFTEIGTWKNSNTGRNVTLWFWHKPAKKKRTK